MHYNFLTIEGNIGSGKTTLSQKLSEYYNTRLLLEKFADNPFLPQFYKKPERYAFPLELFFMAERYTQLKDDFTKSDLFQHKIISDYLFSKSLLFAGVTLQEQEYKLYRRLFSIIQSSLPEPDLCIYLWNSIDNLMCNIKKRGRDFEMNIQPEYLSKIQEAYLNYFKNYYKGKYLILDVSEADFVNNKNDFKKITALLESRADAKNSFIKL